MTNNLVELGPLWREVQAVHTAAMCEGWSVQLYREQMAEALSTTPGREEIAGIIDPLAFAGWRLESTTYARRRGEAYHKADRVLSLLRKEGV